jgi:coenzyme F420-0:L-glutamate ligase/coenzyme F420-1:gamma-L-glutamate ligase
MTSPEIRIIGLSGMPEMRDRDDVASLIVEAARRGPGVEPGDVVVVTQKIVSKAEGRLVRLDSVDPSAEAERLAVETEKDPRLVELILRESNGIVRQRGPVLITETRHGFVCANAGIDASNVGPEGIVCLLPEAGRSPRRRGASRPGPAQRWLPLSATPLGAPGARATPTLRSVSPGCCRSPITSDRWIHMATS